MSTDLTFYEFFAGGGLARIGLDKDWTCCFANDISEKKAAVYRANFPESHDLLVKDINEVTPLDILKQASLAWASFPCQDLSLAGNGKGLQAKRSGAFWAFWSLITSLEAEGRGVPVIAIENVVGLLTSNKGKDLEALLTVLVASSYRPGLLVIDASYFVPQSRPRLFIIAVKQNHDIPDELMCSDGERSIWHTQAVLNAYAQLPDVIQQAWVWWYLPTPPKRAATLRDIVEEVPTGVKWHTKIETEKLLSMMSPVHMNKIRSAMLCSRPQVGTIYKRMRIENGTKVQRAEVRFDNISGCLRTPVGGSSRQILILVHKNEVRSRLLSVREAARLMGLPDSYQLPSSYNEGYHVMGDAVVVPVVSWIEKYLLRNLVLSGASLTWAQSPRQSAAPVAVSRAPEYVRD
jgi:DNA (cytosine-5)-methyltransferase 1